MFHMSGSPDALEQLLNKAGQDPQVVVAVKRLDGIMQEWRRRMNQRELGRRALKRFDLDIDLPQFDVLSAIAAPDHEFGGDSGSETMVSTVAERLSIDPSRASRIVSEMVAAGYVMRAASQQDARRTILELTPAGWAVVRAVLAYKWLVLGDFVSGWSKDDLDTFLPMFERFLQWPTRREHSEARFEAELEQIAATVASARHVSGSGSR